MMATTHAFVGAGLAALWLVVAPAVAPAAMLAGFLGGLAPDLDVLFVHRRSLHFPVHAPPIAALAVLVAVVVPTTATIAAAAFAVAFAVHPITDLFGGSVELRPWQRTTDRAVYDHYHDRWLDARRWVRYDGAPEDLVLASVASLPMFLVARNHLVGVGVGALLVSVGYVLVRKRLHRILALLDQSVPLPLRTLLSEGDQ